MTMTQGSTGFVATPRVKRSSHTLADGREIIFFDEADELVVHEPDRRQLGAVESTGEMRYDATTMDWVIVASHRQDRTHLPSRAECPLCPSVGDHLTEIPDSDYDVAVFENRFPSLSSTSSPPAHDDDLGIMQRPANGRCEVICYSPVHDASLGSCTDQRIGTVMAAWIDRTAALSTISGVEYVFVFENRGAEIGVTLPHPHGQIYAYPFTPVNAQRMILAAQTHLELHGEQLFADVLATEIRAEIRVVVESEFWVGFVPAAARWPVEVHLYPKRRIDFLTELTLAEQEDFAHQYGLLLRGLDGVFDRPLPYISGWYQAPIDPTQLGAAKWHAHLRLISIRRSPEKIKYLAGSESAMGAFINDIAPEAIAERIREALHVNKISAPQSTDNN